METTTIIGNSPELGAVLRTAQVASAADVAILILGESGTGKELLARTIHQDSSRSNHPMAVINCAALPENLSEYDMFGQADGGTLFLSGIDELSLSWQAKLLRFMETGECLNAEGNALARVDARIIAATSRDLSQEAADGRFREDLFYRLNIVPLEVPALRERTGDIPVLLAGLMKELSAKHGVETPRFAKDAQKQLEAYGWPGNVREIRNICERLVILCAGQEIQIEHLPHEITSVEGASSDGLWGFKFPASGIVLEEMEVTLINMALARTDNNRTHAAGLLGISRDALLYRMKKHALR